MPSKQRKRNRKNSSYATGSNHKSSRSDSGKIYSEEYREFLSERLTENQTEVEENKKIWRFSRDAPGWLTSILLVAVAAGQTLTASQGNIDTALAIANSSDTARIMKVAGLGLVVFLVATMPLLFFMYFRHELAIRYRDLTVSFATETHLRDRRVLNRRLQGGIGWLVSFLVLSVVFAPVSLMAPTLVYVVLGAIGAFRSPFHPKNFLATLEREGGMRLQKDDLRDLIHKRVEISNLRRANEAAVLVVIVLFAFFVLLPGQMLPYQEIHMKDNSVLVGSTLGSTSAGTSILQDKPRRVFTIKTEQINNATQCSKTDMANQKSLFGYVNQAGGKSVDRQCGYSTGRFSS